METGQLRYLTASLATGLAALGGALEITGVEYWTTVAALAGIAAVDMIKHRND